MTENVTKLIELAKTIAANNKAVEIFPEHMLFALLTDEFEIKNLLKQMGKNPERFSEFAKKKMRELDPDKKASDLEKVMEFAGYVMSDLKLRDITPGCIFAALMSNELVFKEEELAILKISLKEILDYLKSNVRLILPVDKDTAPSESKAEVSLAETSAIVTFCEDKTLLAKENQLDPVAGRDKELQILIETMLRRSKPNVIIIGEPGVGKTALVDGLAQKIIEKTVPLKLVGAKLFELDLGRLMAGAAYKGEVEDRVKKILKEVKTFDKAILFIDEIHLLQDEKSGFTSVANLLKPELARGRITVIGATTLAEYTKFMEKDQAFKRRFEEVRIDEPEPVLACKMIETVIYKYENFFQLKCDWEIIRKAVELAKRYRRERFLPDSALDLIDSTMSAIKVANELSEEFIQNLETEFIGIQKKTGLSHNKKIPDDLKEFWDELRNNKLHYMHFAKAGMSKDKEDFSDTKELISYIEKLFKQLKLICKDKQIQLFIEDLNAVISNKTGISMGKLEENEQKRLAQIEENLKRRVKGQDYAIQQIANEIRVNRAELGDEKRPIGSFFFFGPTGTGKTELAKAIAEFLFNDESFLVRFDMSEYTEKHSVATFTGAPAGYVGYEEGGVLVNRIRQKPYSVILFDEIEKAHSTVYDIFLQIIDDGRLTDKLGKVGDFSNAIIIFTSNAAQEKLAELYDGKRIPENKEIKDVLKNARDKEGNLLFRIEFINKLSHIVPFAPINDAVAYLILDLKLGEFSKKLQKKGYNIMYSAKAREFLKSKDFDPEFGARSLLGTIRQYIRQPIANMIIENKLKPGQTVTVDLKDNKLGFKVKQPETRANKSSKKNIM